MKRITMEDVAREAGVSRALVSMVFRGVPGVSGARRLAVLDAAERLDFSPNKLASRLASARTNTVGLLIHDLHNPVYATIVEGILEVIDDSPLQLLIATGGASAEREREAMARFVELRTDAVMAVGSALSDDVLLRAARSTQLLLLTRVLETVDSVAVDDERGGYLAAAHLFTLGHRRVAHIASAHDAGYPGRRAGYLAAASEAGATPLVRDAPVTERGGAEAMRALMASPDPPSAVFAYNDVMAIGAMEAVLEAGRDVPGDVALIGYDNLRFAGLRRISLSSIEHQAAEVGRVGAELSLRRLAEPGLAPFLRRLQPGLVVRGSTDPTRVL